MLYLYTIMMRAWDLDKDTHAYFREYLEGFINKRKISKDLREFVLNNRSRAISTGLTTHNEKHKFNELRISLTYRVGLPTQYLRHEQDLRRPKLIENIHPPKYSGWRSGT